jgi:hypothetical protein
MTTQVIQSKRHPAIWSVKHPQTGQRQSDASPRHLRARCRLPRDLEPGCLKGRGKVPASGFHQGRRTTWHACGCLRQDGGNLVEGHGLRDR